MATGTNFIIRLGVKDVDTVKRALAGLGTDGQRALQRIERAGAPASKGLLAINAAASEAHGGMRRLASQAGVLGTALQALGPVGTAVAAGVGAAVAGIGAALVKARAAIDELDRLDDVANKLGVGVEALQELRFAADQTGVSMQTFDLALQRFTRRTAEAAEGTGEAKAALAEMGIALRDQAGNLRPVEDLLDDVADAFAGIEDPAQRVRLAFKLFDSEGVAVVNTLSGGSAALREMRDEARQSGAVIEEDLVRKASLAKDEMAALQKEIDANLNQAFIDLGPVIVKTTKLIADLTGGVASLADSFRDITEQSTRGLEKRLADINKQLAAAPKFSEEGLPPVLGGGRRDPLADLKAARDRIRAQLEARAEADAFAAAARRRTAPPPEPGTDPGAAADKTGFDPDRIRAEIERSQTEARAFVDRVTDAYLQATDQQIALIERRRDADLKALETVAASAAEKEKARVAIVETADAQIAGVREAAAARAARDRDTGFDPAEIRAAIDDAKSDQADARDAALAALERIRDANLQATGEIVALIERRRDREIAALDDIALTEQEKAEARVLINDQANAEIAAEQDRLAEDQRRALDESARLFDQFGAVGTRVLADLALGGEVTADSIIQSFERIALDNAFQQVLGAISGGLFGGGAGGEGFLSKFFSRGFGISEGGSGTALVGTYDAGFTHGGGVPRYDAIPTRSLPASLWDGALRAHTGLLPNEKPIVIRDDEGVFTPGQMRAMGSPRVMVTVNNNATGVDVRARQDSAGVTIDIDSMVANALVRQGSQAQRAVDARVRQAQRVR